MSTRAEPVLWRWAAYGALLGLVGALVLFAPARWLAAGVRSASNGRVVLAEPRGTVWDGSAQLIVTGGAGSNDAAALPGRLQWRLRAAGLGANIQLAAECCTPQPIALAMHWRLRGASLQVADGLSQWPASLLAGLGTPCNTLQPEGELHLSTRALSIEWAEGRLAVSGGAELVAQRMSSRLSTLRPMGSYRITLQGGPTPALRLDTLDGALRLAGSGQWVGGRLRFGGEASAAPEREAALSNLLNIIGRRNGARSIISIG